MPKTIIVVFFCLFWSVQVFAEEATTKAQLDQLWKDGKRLEYVERVVADLERWDGITLLIAANMALQEQRLEDAAVLYYAGRIRTKIDMKHFTPIRKGGSGPAPLVQSLMFSAGGKINSQLPRQPEVYQAMVKRLAKWEPPYTSDYDPGWEYEAVPNFYDLQEEFKAVKQERVRDLNGLATLLSHTEYKEALSMVNSYNTDVTKDQQAKEKLNAVETMKRIERELGLNAHMAYMAKIAIGLVGKKCFDRAEDGGRKEIECNTNDEGH